MSKTTVVKICETFGSLIAIVYALLIASNTGNEVLGFSLLLVSAVAFAVWAVLDSRWAFLVLQAFYIGTAILGIWRWS